MIVITLTDTPPSLRGDLSKWLLEINTGVYVGNVSARVREKLWERVCLNLKNGRATMVYNAKGEQKMDFRVHNSAWQPVDYDGIKLIRHPLTGCQQEREDGLTKEGYSKAAKQAYARKSNRASHAKKNSQDYMVIDLETTGLSYEKDHIIETAALQISNGKVINEFNKLIQIEEPLKEDITHLTGITDDMLKEIGEPYNTVLEQFIKFIQTDVIVGYNTLFDLNFLQKSCQSLGLTMPQDFKMIDVLKTARKKIMGLSDYKLNTLGNYFGLDISGAHRALKDCYLTYEVFEKLNEL